MKWQCTRHCVSTTRHDKIISHAAKTEFSFPCREAGVDTHDYEKLLKQKLLYGISDPAIDDFWRSWVKPDEKHVSVQLRDLAKSYGKVVGFADQENGDPKKPDEMPSVVCEFFESPKYIERKRVIEQRHNSDPARRGKKFFVLSYALFADKHRWIGKQSGQTLFFDLLNFKKSVRNLQPIRMLVAECDTNLHDTPHSLYGVLAVLLPEATSLANGIEVYCKKERKPVWVYANLDLLIADSQEWWHFASVNPPSGNSNFCCTSCLASLDDFAKACTTGKRDYKLAKEAVLEARNVAHDQKAVEAILAKHHLHACALYNPLFTWPGMDDLFEIITPDPLHLVLFYFKGLVKDLLQGLPVSYRETLEQRITVANEFLSDLMKVPSLKCRKNWRGREGRNFGLLAPYLLEGLTSVAVLDLWTLVATMFSMVYFPGRTEGSALALGVVAHKAIAAILETYKNKQGKVRHQLNLHSPLHLSFFVEKIGPASLFDTERAENAQAKVAEISEQTSYKMQQYALRNASCFQLLSIHSMVEDVGSKDYELFHRAAGDAAHMYRTTVHQVDMEVEDEGGEKKIERLWVLDGVPLQQGTVVCTLGDTAAKVSPPAHLSDFDRGFYEYCEVWGVDAENGLVLTKPLVQPPGGSLCQSPFEWARPQSHADQPLGKIEFSKVHRCPIVLPRFKDITAKLSNKVSVVVPTRFLVANLS
eukprot:m51a1_g2926 hypothetical protein (702) ;mRNA; r:557990-560794